MNTQLMTNNIGKISTSLDVKQVHLPQQKRRQRSMLLMEQQLQGYLPATNALDSIMLHRQRIRNRRLLDEALVMQRRSAFGGCGGNGKKIIVDFDEIVRDLRHTIDETMDQSGNNPSFPKIEWNSDEDEDLLAVPCNSNTESPNTECILGCMEFNPIKVGSRTSTRKRVGKAHRVQNIKQIPRSNKICSKMNLFNPKAQMIIQNARKMVNSSSPNTREKKMIHRLKRRCT